MAAPRRIFVDANVLIAGADSRTGASNAVEDVLHWQTIIEAKDALILATAVTAQVDRFLTLNSKDFTPEVAAQSGLQIMTPGRVCARDSRIGV